jgi:hypothetical protein
VRRRGWSTHRRRLIRPVKRGKPTRGWTLGHQKIRQCNWEGDVLIEGLALGLPSLSDVNQDSVRRGRS